LDKTVGKMVKNQRADGQFAGNEAWAPVLSQGLAGKGLAKARMAGADVKDEVLARVQAQSAAGLSATPPATGGEALALRGGATPAPTGGRASAGGAGVGGGGAALGGRAAGFSRGMAPAGAAGRPGDAGVPLYRFGQGATNLQDVANANRAAEKEARDVLA